MDRRRFVTQSSIIAAIPMMGTVPVWPVEKKNQKPEWLVKLLQLNDQQINEMVANRQEDPTHFHFGGFADGNGIVNAQATANFVKMGICSLVSEESAFYHSEALKKQVIEAILWLLKMQHPDGSLDLHSTNFNSPPDTGFIIKWLGPPARLLLDSKLKDKEEVTDNLKLFMQRAGNCLINGGIHTPNHRWVVSAAMAWLHMLWPNPQYVRRAEQWLAEGIDIDADGQFHERSTHVYTPLTNRALIMIARGFNKPELLDHVRRNLEMSMYYVHPNGEVVTEASGRQDKAVAGTMESYYFPYRYMAIRDQNPQFAAMCRLIEKTAFEKARYSSLHNILEDRSLWKELPKAGVLPTDYEKYFSHSGLVHIRRGSYDASIISNNPAFFTFHKGNAVLQGVRMASAFFGKGQFMSEELIKEGNAWKLTRELAGPYYQPLAGDLVTGDNDWGKTPRGQRQQSEIQKLMTTVDIREKEGGFELEIKIEGTERVPVAVELVFRPGGTFYGLERLVNDQYAWLLKEGTGTYSVGNDAINFGPGTHAHQWVRLRGALPGMDAPTVFLTGFTPFYHTIEVS